MSTTTENYGLILPEQEDTYDVAVFNENFDTLDGVVGAVENTVGAVNEKMGEPAATGTTIFSLLENSGGTFIKSAQRVVYNVPYNTSSGSVSIETVDPQKCFVIFERLANSSSALFAVNYSLTAETLEITHDTTGVATHRFGFWIIEFS